MSSPETTSEIQNHRAILTKIGTRHIYEELETEEYSRLEAVWHSIAKKEPQRALIIAANLGLEDELVTPLLLRLRQRTKKNQIIPTGRATVPNSEPEHHNSFTEFSKNIWSEAVNFTRKHVGDFEDAKDVTLEVLTNMWLLWPTDYHGQSPQAHRAILFKAILNERINFFRDEARRGRQQTLSLDQIIERPSSLQWYKLTDNTPSAEETVVETLERQEQLDTIAEGIKILEPHRRKLALLVIGGCRHGEAAKVLGFSTEGAAKISWSRICHHIRRTVGIQD